MKRVQIIAVVLLLIAAGALASVRTAHAQPATAPTNPGAPAAGAGAGSGAATPGATPGQTGAGASSYSDSTGSTTTPDQEAVERAKIWNGPEMKIAREWVLEYGRRSTTFNSLAAERYLARVSQMSPTQMKRWLDDFKSRQANTTRTASVVRAARQTAIDQSIARLQAVQRSYSNINQGQTEGALAIREQQFTRQDSIDQLAANKQANREGWLVASQNFMDYNWIVNPPYWMKAGAAASSTPGDLLPGDPANFIRGDVFPPGETPPSGAAGAPAAAGNAGGAAAAAAGNAAGAAAAAAGNAGGGGGGR